MSLDFIREHYRVPAEIMGRVRFTWPSPAQEGTIVGATDHRLLVLLDSDDEPAILHPTWEIDYFTSDGWRAYDGFRGEESR